MTFEVNDLLIRDIAFKALDTFANEKKEERETNSFNSTLGTLIEVLLPWGLRWLNRKENGKIAKFIVSNITPSMHVDEDDNGSDNNHGNEGPAKSESETETQSPTNSGESKKDAR